MGSARRKLLIGPLAAAVAAASIALTVHANAAVPAPPTGWQLVFSDDFAGAANSPPSSANWLTDTGTSYPGGPANWGTGERQSYTTNAANLAQDGSGNLRITPIRDATGAWTSGRIESVRTNFKPPSGGVLAMEGRIKMPSVTGVGATGYWPAFWALGSPYRGNYQNWPGIGELDIMENVNGINSVWGTLHCGVNPGGPCNETTGLGSKLACPSSTCQSAYHTYRFEWDTSVTPNQMRWYVDGVQYHSVTADQVGASAWNQLASHEGYFLLLNLAIGGAFPDAIQGSATPTSQTESGSSMLVDYVAVYSRGGGASTSPSASPSASKSTSPSTSPSASVSASPSRSAGPSPSAGRDAYATIQAESFVAQHGISAQATSDAGGGQNIGWIANGDWARYDTVNFGAAAARQFVARVSSGVGGGRSGLVEVRLDALANQPIGSFAIANTGGWDSWRTVPANIASVTGVHTVFLTFTSGQPDDFVNVNWFSFGH
jgi:hypothetical protein